MRKRVVYIILILLLAIGAAICALRWQAWFGMPDEPQWTGETKDYRFPTWEADKTPESLDILVLGDIHNSLQKEDYDSLARRVPQADAVAQVGDWLERGYPYYYQLLLREWTDSKLADLPVIACPGNHEYSKGVHKSVSPVWEYAFTHPQNGPEGVPGVSYFIDLPAVRFIMIDTNPLIRLVYLTRTLTWMEQTMRSAGDRYVVVMMHHPVLSAREGRFNPTIYTTFRYALSKADLVIAGHDHSYMRQKPFVVLNTGGKVKPQKERIQNREGIITAEEPVYGVLTIAHPEHGTRSPLLFRVYRLSDDALLDSFYVSHQ